MDDAWSSEGKADKALKDEEEGIIIKKLKSPCTSPPAVELNKEEV